MSGFAESLRQLRSAQKSNKGAPLYSVLINRPLGRVFAAAGHQLGMTPNQITALSAVFTFAGIITVAVVPPSPVVGILVSGLLVIGYALDAADGQLARLRGGGSMLGEWLDHVIDSLKIATVHLAVAISLYRFSGLPEWVVLIAFGFSAVGVVHFSGFLLTELLARVHHAQRGEPMPPKGSPSVWSSVVKLPTDYGLLCLLFALGGWPKVFIWPYALMALATAGYTVLVLPRWGRRLVELDRVASA